MSKERIYTDYLHDILDYANRAEQFVQGMSEEQFMADLKTQGAVIHAVIIIGEAASKIPTSIREQYPEVPWRAAITMRNRLIHAYPGVDLGVVWDTMTNDLPSLKAQVAAILADMERGGAGGAGSGGAGNA